MTGVEMLEVGAIGVGAGFLGGLAGVWAAGRPAQGTSYPPSIHNVPGVMLIVANRRGSGTLGMSLGVPGAGERACRGAPG
jgi:hypothetical protein